MLAALFLTVGFASCTKSTKGKMANDWKVVSMTSESSSTDFDGNKNVSTQNANETTLTTKSVTTATDGSITTTLGSAMINKNEFTIEKDGAWKWIQDLSYSTDSGVVRTTNERSGTWSFIGKNKGDEFKKNERVLFNVLKVNYSIVHKNQGTIIDQQNASSENLQGDVTLIYTIKESKKDELQLEMESERISDQAPNLSKSASKSSMTLKTK